MTHAESFCSHSAVTFCILLQNLSITLACNCLLYPQHASDSTHDNAHNMTVDCNQKLYIMQDADAESEMPHEWRMCSGEEKVETTEPKL